MCLYSTFHYSSYMTYNLLAVAKCDGRKLPGNKMDLYTCNRMTFQYKGSFLVKYLKK